MVADREVQDSRLIYMQLVYILLVDLGIVCSEPRFVVVFINFFSDSVVACLAIFVNGFDYDVLLATLCLNDFKLFV